MKENILIQNKNCDPSLLNSPRMSHFYIMECFMWAFTVKSLKNKCSTYRKFFSHSQVCMEKSVAYIYNNQIWCFAFVAIYNKIS